MVVYSHYPHRAMLEEKRFNIVKPKPDVKTSEKTIRARGIIKQLGMVKCHIPNLRNTKSSLLKFYLASLESQNHMEIGNCILTEQHSQLYEGFLILPIIMILKVLSQVVIS
jgi:hypothetical protein